jgi:hypothetical protein
MKKLLLILAVLITSFNSYADMTDIDLKIIMASGVIMMPFIAFGGTIAVSAMIPKVIYEDGRENSGYQKGFYKDYLTDHKIQMYNVCHKLEKLYIDADKVDVYIGKEKPGQSNITDALNISSASIYEKDKYLCIDPKPTKVYKNGCLDTLEKDSIKKVSGKWNLDKAFYYYNIGYVQLMNDNYKNRQFGFTDAVSAINHIYYDGEKINLENENIDVNNFSLYHAIQLNCG